jgi:hypothetical protein
MPGHGGCQWAEMEFLSTKLMRQLFQMSYVMSAEEQAASGRGGARLVCQQQLLATSNWLRSRSCREV